MISLICKIGVKKYIGSIKRLNKFYISRRRYGAKLLGWIQYCDDLQQLGFIRFKQIMSRYQLKSVIGQDQQFLRGSPNVVYCYIVNFRHSRGAIVTFTNLWHCQFNVSVLYPTQSTLSSWLDGPDNVRDLRNFDQLFNIVVNAGYIPYAFHLYIFMDWPLDEVYTCSY